VEFVACICGLKQACDPSFGVVTPHEIFSFYLQSFRIDHWECGVRTKKWSYGHDYDKRKFETRMLPRPSVFRTDTVNFAELKATFETLKNCNQISCILLVMRYSSNPLQICSVDLCARFV